jgi:hypothetical protein
MNSSRNNFKWGVNECLRLEREYNLLKLDVDKIAELHKRSNKAIIFCLYREGFISCSEKNSCLDKIQTTNMDFNKSKNKVKLINDETKCVENKLEIEIESDFESDSESESESELWNKNNNDDVSQRVNKLESSVTNMESMITTLYNYMTKSNTTK